MFPPIPEGAAPSDEDDFDLIRIQQTPQGVVQSSFLTKQMATMTAIRKHLRFGYNGDTGMETGWTHKESLTPTMANKLQELNVDSDLEILLNPAAAEPSVL
jgi:hypothetical protein